MCVKQNRLVDRMLNAAAPLLFYFLYDLESKMQQQQQQARSRRVPTTPDTCVSRLLSALESKLAANNNIVVAEQQLKLAGVFITLLRAFSGCARRQHDVTESGEVSRATCKLRIEADRRRLELNKPTCKRILDALKHLCDQEHYSADIKTLVYSAMPAISRSNAYVEICAVDMLLARIDSYNSNNSERRTELIAFSHNEPRVCHVNTIACVEFVSSPGGDGVRCVLVEPVDVLLQALEMCVRSSWLYKAEDTISDPYMRAIRMLEAMSRIYLHRDGDGMTTGFTNTNMRLLEAECRRLAVNGAPLSDAAMLGVRLQCLQIAHQLALGVVETFLEREMMVYVRLANSYANITMLLSRHQVVRSVFSARLEQMRRELESNVNTV